MIVETVELTANIHREDGSYWAEVSELPGCFGSGDTLDDLIASLREGIQLYLGEGGHLTANGSLGSPLQVRAAILSDSAPA